MKRTLLLTAIFIISTSNIFAQDKAAKIDTLMWYWQGVTQFNGTVLVAHKGDTILHRGYGPREVRKGDQCSKNTLYQLGTTTELFTSALIFKLIEEGKLSLDDKVSKFYPKYPDGEKITIGNLLSHTSGIYDYMANDTFYEQGINSARTRNEVLSVFYGRPLAFKPGTKYSHSASNYALLGYIIEEITGKKYYHALREQILEPLNIENSGFNFSGYASWDKAQGYAILNQFRMVPAMPIDSTVGYASSGLFTSSEGLYQLAKAYINKSLLSEKSWSEMTTTQKDSFTYGWQNTSIYGMKAIRREGVLQGSLSSILIIPADSTVIILMSNDAESEIGYVQNDIASILYDQPYQLPKPKEVVYLEDRVMQQYEGRYEMPDGTDIHFYFKNKLLYGKINGQAEFTILAETIDKFFMQPVDVTFTFIRDKQRLVTDVIIRKNRIETKAHKWQ